MPYPTSPFAGNFPTNLLLNSRSDSADREFQNITKWLCASPKITSYRVNTLKYSPEDIKKLLEEKIREVAFDANRSVPKVSFHSELKEVVLLNNWNVSELDLGEKQKEVVVDEQCGAAVLRGAHIFAPGVLGMLSGTNIGDEISIYVDLSKTIKKGFRKVFESSKKVFIGNGVVRMDRSKLFSENVTKRGVAVEVTDTISGCPALGDFLPRGCALLQNIPSIVCVHALNPKPGDAILDMCASPGNKTTLIAALMENNGCLIALDKTPNKIKVLKESCDNFGASTYIFQADSTKIVDLDKSTKEIVHGPPFACESFDKILLDAPCSALGKRPQLFNNTTENVLRSYVPLQRKLFENAVQLLKINGILVYSTCTITTAENEEIVRWALKTFPNMKLIPAQPHLGGKSFKIDSLNESDMAYLQRYGPNDDVDSVGFFIACFKKI